MRSKRVKEIEWAAPVLICLSKTKRAAFGQCGDGSGNLTICGTGSVAGTSCGDGNSAFLSCSQGDGFPGFP